MSKVRKFASDALSWLLCICLVIGWGGVSNLFLNTQQAHAVDIGANPAPKVDIAVALPTDYPGTFLDFKAELTEKLIAQGMDPSDFRITDTATKIDATDQSTWVVYDHYYDRGVYDSKGYSMGNEATHPFRAADNTCTNAAAVSGVIPMSRIFGGGGTTNKCANFESHSYTYDDNGKTNMVFAGYGTKELCDYMYYPSANTMRRNVSFNLDASVIDNHTLLGAGFLFNVAITNGKINGYALFIVPSSSSANATATIYKLTNWDVNSSKLVNGQATAVGSSKTINLGANRKARISLDIGKVDQNGGRVVVQTQPLDANNNPISVRPVEDFNVLLPVHGDSSHGGFGPIVSYKSHGCSSLTVFKYLDLEMKFDASAFDALNTVQYYQGAQQKYFINIADNNGNHGIPNPTNPETEDAFTNGINRLDQNELFYLSNVDDGWVLRDTEFNEDGSVKQQGVGADNGYIAPGAGYTSLMATYIYENFINGATFKHGPVASPRPLANFYLVNSQNQNEQIMTVHLKHLENTAGQGVKIFDKSKPGTAAGADGKITQYRYVVYDPNNAVVPGYEGTWYSSPEDIPTFTFTNDMKTGKYLFELQVRDQDYNDADDVAVKSLHESTIFQTYIIAFRDTKFPIIEGANTHENIATFTITDTGEGIEEDGITFKEDGRGSGVAAYYITTDPNDDPRKGDKWQYLTSPQHSVAVDYELENTKAIYVWSKDECGNVGYINNEGDDHVTEGPAVFRPTKVRVEDKDGKPIKEYIVIGEKPIIVLPPDDEVPDPDDPENEQFAGWVTPGGDDVTPGHTPTPDEENVIVIRPSYSSDQAKMVYLANGGTILDRYGKEVADKYSFDVMSGASIMKKMDDHYITAKKKGNSFAGWKLLKTDKLDSYGDLSNIPDADLEEIAKQVAKVEKTGDTITRDTYYLVATWQEGKYTLRLDPNGGFSGTVSKYADVPYETPIKEGVTLTDTGSVKTLPASGREAPTRNGHFFAGWSTEPLKIVTDWVDLQGKLIMASAEGKNHGINSLAQNPTMGDGDMKLYAAWVLDKSQTVFSFDSNGGTSVNDQAYTSSETEYAAFQTPTRPGYVFEGWYEKTGEDADGNPITSEVKVGGEGSPLKFEGGALDASVKGHQYTFVAKWTPGQETPYTVEYYVNSGNKDRNGNYIYTKVDHERADGTPYTITRTGITEKTVSIEPSDVLPELSFHGHSYWHNPNSSHIEVVGEGDEATTRTVPNNVTSGVVTGIPHLALRLYYDRYLDITGVKALDSTGEGTVTSVTGQKEGSKPTVTWQAAEGSYVERVVVNGEVRDDLLRAGSFTPADGLFSNTTVRVKFTKGEDPKGTPGENTPTGPRVEPKTYSINTTVRGCTNTYNGCSITPTQVYKAGENVTITFNGPCKTCKILRVEVDGRKVNVTGNSVTFKQLSADHNVDVYVAPKNNPSMGGKDTEDVYSITVNRYGGDNTYYTSSSRTISMDDAANGDWTFEWNRTKDGAQSKHRIYSIKVDGMTYPGLVDTRVLDEGSIGLDPGKNHVVDVYFYDIETDPATPNEPEYVEPDFSRPDQWVSVTTEIVGGAGEIDPGFSAKKDKEGEEYEVNYSLKNAQNYADDDYMYYDLEKVEVNDKELAEGEYETTPDGDGNVKVTLRPATDNAHVRVTVKPVAVNVDTMTMTMKKQQVLDANDQPVKDENGADVTETVLEAPTAGGTISSSKSVGKYGNYTTIVATPKSGYQLLAFEKVDILNPQNNHAWVWDDDASKFVEKPVSSLTALTPAAFSMKTMGAEASEVVDDEAAGLGAKDNQTSVSRDDGKEAAGGDGSGASSDSAAQPSGDEQDTVADEAQGSEADGNGDEVDQSSADADEGAQDAPIADDPVPTAASEAQADVVPVLMMASASCALPLYSEELPAATTEDDPSLLSLFGVEKAYAEEGSSNGPTADANVFRAPNGNSDGATVGYVNLTEGQRVIAYFGTSDITQADTEDLIKTRDEKSFPVTVTFEGAGDLAGTYTGAGAVAKDGSTTVTFGDWPKGYKYVDASVDGSSNATVGPVTDATDGKKQIQLSDITGPVNVKVQLKKTDDPTRKSESPLEETGFEPRYRVTATVEGYGGLVISRNPSSATVVAGSRNAQNYELSWEPKDLKDNTVPGSNTNIPYIASFKVNGVEDEGKLGPVTSKGSYVIPNVDKDYQIEIRTILLNEDTDGDGDPDYNIDDDGDGDPDRNVDTDGDGLPDTNVDTDGDGEPDVNIDTDGDGKPDKNIYDKDLDGTPDNVDPKAPNPPKPNVNVVVPDPNDPDKEIILNHDTDGDGIPDLDIVDEDGDGKPDSIDPTDPNPPAPNVNVDTDKDGKPNLFIDVDHDFLPDVNIDTDKDGRPDINIDTDGDLEPDVNIDTDGTDTWYPSSRGGNADKIWKPYKNIDTGDGKGPIHTDTTAAVDEDKNGVDDRWKPEHNTAAANGFEYDTMAADWVDDGDLSADPGAKDPDNGSDPSKSDKGDKSDSNDKGGKSDNDKGKTKLAQTSDDLLPSMAFAGMMALTALAVCFWASRRGDRYVRGKHAR